MKRVSNLLIIPIICLIIISGARDAYCASKYSLKSYPSRNRSSSVSVGNHIPTESQNMVDPNAEVPESAKKSGKVVMTAILLACPIIFLVGGYKIAKSVKIYIADQKMYKKREMEEELKEKQRIELKNKRFDEQLKKQNMRERMENTIKTNKVRDSEEHNNKPNSIKIGEF